MRNITSHGIIVVGITTTLSLPSDQIAIKFEQTIDWSATNLNSYLTKYDVFIDFDYVAAMGHSAGGRMVMILN
jgi:hypothetical protein